MKYSFLFAFIGLLIGSMFMSCGADGDNPPPPPPDEFNRRAMLEVWSDQAIIPGYSSLINQLQGLKVATDNFNLDPTADRLSFVQATFVEAYINWQRVSLYEIGKAEEIAHRAKMNTYPTDTVQVRSNALDDAIVNLDLPSQFSAQGFPALDYLLYGIEEGELLNNEEGAAYRLYMQRLVDRMADLSQEVLTDWQMGYRNVFVEADGNSATASTDRMVNDLLFYYEKFLRAGKVGIPAGVFSSGKLPQNVEALYNKEIGKGLLLEAIKHYAQFFSGDYEVGRNADLSLAGYINHLEVEREDVSLAAIIDNQFSEAIDIANTLDNDLSAQVETNNTDMLRLYDALQANVVLLKVDMLQALNINVDFVDADGD